jgi:hypothetical protein
VRAGFDVVTLDAYGDLDQPSACHTLPPGTPWRAAVAARQGRGIGADAVVYLSNLDNDPRAVASLAAGRRLWGTPPQALRRARDPLATRDVFRAAGADAPDVLPSGHDRVNGQWLQKPLRSGGGVRVRRWRGPRVPRGCYAQAFVEGRPGSVLFVASGGRAVVLATSRQLIGDPAFGAAGFRYCGTLLDLAHDPVRRAQATVIANAAATIGLAGICGVDFIDDGRVMHPIEVNPRWPASAELAERCQGQALFAVHAEACATGDLPSAGPAAACPHGKPLVYGKAIVFAREDVTVGDTRGWLGDATMGDIPRPGSRIAARQPVCTVFAEAADQERCRAALVLRASSVYERLAPWTRAVA